MRGRASYAATSTSTSRTFGLAYLTALSGEGGIRTLGGVAATPVFETGPIGRSGTSPGVDGSNSSSPASPREAAFPGVPGRPAAARERKQNAPRPVIRRSPRPAPASLVK